MDLGSIDLHTVSTDPFGEKEHPAKTDKDNVYDHIETVTNTLETCTIIIGLAHFKSKGCIWYDEDCKCCSQQNTDAQQIHEQHLSIPKRFGHKPQCQEREGHEHTADEHVGMTAAEAGVGTIGDRSHQRIGNRIPNSSDR